MQHQDADLMVVGKVLSAYGVKGWVKLYSYTEPMENLLAYSNYLIRKPGAQWQSLDIEQANKHGKGLVAKFAGIDNREQVALLTHSEIAIEKSALPPLDNDEFYWHQLVGLKVESEYQGQRYQLGNIKHLMETGANDVIVVQPDSDSIDDRERLIPYVPEQFILSIDLSASKMLVEWDPAF